MSEEPAERLLQAVELTLEDHGVDPDEHPRLVAALAFAILHLSEQHTQATWQAALERLGSSAGALAIIRRLVGDGTAGRADAGSWSLHPEALRRAEQRLEKLLREKV